MNHPSVKVTIEDLLHYPQTVDETLAIIQQALFDKVNGIKYLTKLFSMTLNEEEQSIIKSIISNDQKHLEYLCSIYQLLSSHDPLIETNETILWVDFFDAIKELILLKSTAIEFERRILFMMKDHKHIERLTELITDELRHSTLLNLLFLMGISHCSNERQKNE